MRKLLLIAAMAMTVASCKSDNHFVIQEKSYTTFWDQPLPEGICRYIYGDYTSQDSCTKYQIGDTIKH